MDGAGNMFAKTSIEITIDDKRAIAVLEAEQVELILKLLQVVKYAD